MLSAARHRATVAAAALVCAGLAGTPSGSSVIDVDVSPSVAAPGLPRAMVGAVFTGEDARHSCTGTVVHSTGGDLVVTAAHCLGGDGVGVEFVPGYADGAAPHGVWTSVAACAAPAWLQDQDPASDVAVLRMGTEVVHGRDQEVEAVVGRVLPALVSRADAGAAPDTLPAPGPDGC